MACIVIVIMFPFILFAVGWITACAAQFAAKRMGIKKASVPVAVGASVVAVVATGLGIIQWLVNQISE